MSIFTKAPCAVCLSKNERISDLKEHIAFLEKQLTPIALSPGFVEQAKETQAEANFILSGAGEAAPSLASPELSIDDQELMAAVGMTPQRRSN